MRRMTLDGLLRARPPGLWSGNDQMAWHPAPGVVGVSLARRLSTTAMLPLSTVVETVLRGRAPVRTFVLDASRLESDGCDGAALLAVQRFVLDPLATRGSSEVRVVASQGLGQVALVGAVTLAAPRAWRVFPRLDHALHDLGEAGQPPPWAADLLGAISAELAPLGIISRVRGLLGENPSRSLADVAQRLGVPTRTLQRALGEAATTFNNERTEVRLELAAERLSRTTEKLHAIATEVGYRSLPHFSAVFSARFGLSPRAFRARRRQHDAP